MDNKQPVKDAYLEADLSLGLVKRTQMPWAATLEKVFCIQLDLARGDTFCFPNQVVILRAQQFQLR